MAIKFLNTVAVDTDVLYVDASSNKVGIGTTSPSQIFTIENNSGFFRINTSTSTYPRIEVGSASGSTAAIINRITGSQNIIFGESSDSGNYIFRGGNVGIGTTSPSFKLDVNGSTNIDGTLFVNAVNNHIRLIDSNGTGNFSVGVNNNFQIRDITANTTPLTIKAGTPGNTIVTTSSGNVGIGTPSPQEELHISSSVPAIRIEDTDGGYAQIVGSNGSLSLRADQANTVASSIIDFSIDNSERMRIEAGGNVGIGTTSPSSKFVVADGMSGGSSQTGLEFIPQDSNNRNIIFSYDRSSSAYKQLNFDASDFRFNPGGSTQVVIDSSGNVGIGTTSPSNKLDVIGDASVTALRVGSSASGEGIIRHYSTGGQGIGIVTGTINASGIGLYVSHSANNRNVGVGTTDPQSKLQVDGGVQMADDTDTASADKVGTLRYRTSGNNSYVDMCMQTGATTYEWVNIVQNNW